MARLMSGFPPTPELQVALANWRKHPYSQWSFRNVRQIIPTAPIRPSASPKPLVEDLHSIDGTSFEGIDGKETTVRDARLASFTDGMLVLRGGRIVSEWYNNGLDPVTPHICFSVSKSILGTLAGVLTEREIIDPDALVIDYLPEVKGSAYETAKLRHLLDMTVGTSYREEFNNPSLDLLRYRSATGWDPQQPGMPEADLRKFLPTVPLGSDPHGAKVNYVTPNTDTLGWLFERACGRPYAQLLSEFLWAPMGAEVEGSMTVDPFGMTRPGGGISATLRDLARFGEMMRRRGLANGQQVVPGWWIDDIRRNGSVEAWMHGCMTDAFPIAQYRSKWYNLGAPGGAAFCGVGIHGQWIYIDERAETVIARFSSQPDPMDLPIDHMWLRGYDAIARRLSS
ncbi:serine hydrolase [Bradyrhizobium manausense]|uniref:serine hydrolase domain-containing protein n=1 Tax=Bradyrhizobium manausense TaxID=989370 RepID=UPI001BA44839|nr:serine hydrolase [Bradyrhizobium manausense]MBR0834199.1 serine hydrolase [Bradyrhizobium manausense]